MGTGGHSPANINVFLSQRSGISNFLRLNAKDLKTEVCNLRIGLLGSMGGEGARGARVARGVKLAGGGEGGLDLEAYFVRRNCMATVNTLPKHFIVANVLNL